MVGGDNDKIKKKANIDLSKLPPCLNTFRPHTDRVNYKTGIGKTSHIARPNIPSPEHNGWMYDDGGLIQPHCSYGAILPDRLIDIVEGIQSTSSDEEETDDGCSLSDQFITDSEDEDSDLFSRLIGLYK